MTFHLCSDFPCTWLCLWWHRRYSFSPGQFLNSQRRSSHKWYNTEIENAKIRQSMVLRNFLITKPYESRNSFNIWGEDYKYLFSSVCLIDCWKIKLVDVSGQGIILFHEIRKLYCLNWASIKMEMVSGNLRTGRRPTCSETGSITELWGIHHIFYFNILL